MRSMISLTVLFAVAAAASASTVNLQLGYVYADSAATELLPVGMTGLLIADADGSGWDAYAAPGGVGADSFLADDTDVILGAFGFNGAIAGAGTHSEGLYWDNEDKGVDEGMEFALFWFNTPYAEGIETAGPGDDVSFGYFRTDDVLGASDFGYVVPANNVGGFLQSYTVGTGAGSIPDADMAAKYVTGAAPALPGDANGDGAVTDADYTIWADNYNATGATSAMGDFNGDGSVTDADYTIWADNYGAGTGAIPEPATFGLLALGALTALRRRK